jgi:hypothetical protein
VAQRRLRRALALICMLVVGGVAAGQVPASAGSDVTVFAEGLNNPRGLSFGPHHGLYVAEAGKGGDGPCFEHPELGELCVGLTGSVTRVWPDGTQQRVVRRLPSIAAPDGSAAAGPHSASVRTPGNIYVTTGLFGTPQIRRQYGPEGRNLGRLLWTNLKGQVQRVADLAGYEAAANPDGGAVDSDPYGLWAGKHRRIVTDAGGNSLLRVGRSGRVHTMAVFPDRLVDFNGEEFPMQAVPTGVVRGPDGAFYVGQLTGFPFPVGGARVYRVVPGEKPTIYRRGFTNIIDIDFGSDGSLYVLEIAHNSLLADNPEGALIRVTPDGDRSVVTDGLIFPGGLAIGSLGKLYVTNCGVCPGTGEVLRISP